MTMVVGKWQCGRGVISARMAIHHFGTSMSLLGLRYDMAKQVNGQNALVVIELQLKKLDIITKGVLWNVST
jgi:hypothetical protein